MDVLRGIYVNFRRYTGPSVLSLAGTVMAFCAFAIAVMQIRFEKGFDRFHPHSDCLFRVDMKYNNTVFRSVLPPGFAEAVISSSPHVVAGTVVNPFLGDVYVTVETDGGVRCFKEPANTVSHDFFKVFGMDILEGDAGVLSRKDMLAIPESLALKFFGNESALGKLVKVKSGAGFINSDTWTVGAVYRDMPENSQIRNEIYMGIADDLLHGFMQSNFVCYLRLDTPESACDVENGFNGSFDFSAYGHLTPVSLLPMPEIYFREENSDGRIFRSGSRMQMNVLGVIAFLVVLAALMNFTNLYAAMVPARLRGLNTRMVLGESVRSVRLRILCETSVMMLAGAVLALLVSVPLSEYMYGQGMVGCTLSLSGNLPVVLITLSVSLICGIVSGMYPAFFATSFTPALVLKGNFSFTASGRRIKECLVVLQYAVSFTLVALVAVIYMQNMMMSHTDTQFDSDSLAVVELTPELLRKSSSELDARLMELPEVEKVAFASETIGSQDTYSTQGIEYNGEEIPSFMIYVSTDFPEAAGLKMVDGRAFSEHEYGAMIVNRYAAENYGISAGTFLYGNSEFTGICEDIAITSMRKAVSPVCFVSLPAEAGFFSVVYVKLRKGSDAVTASEHIKKVVSDIDPELSADVSFYDGIMSSQYRRETSFGKIVLFFSILAVILSITGVFSMIVFDIRQKTKEITVRKIFGAGYSAVVLMGNRPYFLMALAGFIISVPFALYASDGYLSGFVRRIDIPAAVFAVSFVAMELLTSLLVLWRFHAAARQNPADAIRKE